MNNKKRISKLSKLTTRLIICFTLAACNLPLMEAAQVVDTGTGTAGVEIVFPEDGAKLNAGEMIDVISILVVPAGGSAQILSVNDQTSRTDRFITPFRSGKVYQPWTPPGPGEFTLQVNVESFSGEKLLSTRVTVFVGEQDIITPTPTIGTPTLTTITETPTPTIGTPTLTLTLMTVTEEQALARADTDLNCRSGPGVAYIIIDALHEGETSPVIGTNTDRTWILIEGPIGSMQCWVHAQYVTMNRDISSYTVYPAPPLPITFTPTLITPTLTATWFVPPKVTPPTNTPDGPTTP
ncbi:MAG: hypothetical protein MUO76_24510 [Anaerolineaceae bacterium]|nr:hypothetical protein [Anaerolineaceae bacterium]